ncbi:phage holin family protein [Candidatus Parcubacteria bacterium]|nr:phage holin family protein [Candidatus Parcubacteria bacterium]
MKKLLRSFLINATAIYLVSRALVGLDFREDLRILATAALGLTLLNLLVKPIVKILALPIHFLTLGLLSWLIDALMLYLATSLIEGFQVSAFLFRGFSYQGFFVPTLHISQFWAVVLISCFIGFIHRSLSWLFK